MKRLIILGSLTILLIGCATTGNYEKNLQNLVGSSESRLISSWGKPDVISHSKGVKKVIYKKETIQHVPGPTLLVNNIPVYTKDLTVYLHCNTTFNILDGTIKSFRFEGNGCRSKAL